MMNAASKSGSTSNNSASEQDSQLTAEEEQKEREHFQKVVDAFRYYRYHIKFCSCDTVLVT